MKLASLLVLSVTLATSALSQNLGTWTAEDQVPGGEWTVSLVGERVGFTVSNQSARSFYYGVPTPLASRGRVSVRVVGSDNDFLGFVFGFKPGDTISRDSDYLLLDWKRSSENNASGLLAREGLALSRVSGPGATTPSGASIDFWAHIGDVTELVRAQTRGSRGWNSQTDYEFDIDYRRDRITILVNGTLEFDIAGTFPRDGFFGFYNFSQNAVRYSFEFPSASSEEFGVGCPGGDDQPVLQALPGSLPRMDETFALELSNLSTSSSAATFGVLGFSDTTWAGFDLPKTLAEIGAPTCMQYVAADALILLPPSGSTALWDIGIPLGQRMIGLEFYVQGLVVDAFGAVPVAVTNAVAGVVGMH